MTVQQINKTTALSLIQEALNNPGRQLAAYRAFHNFSLNNQMWAASQLAVRGLDIQPIKTFKQWADVSRSVKKGEKALSLVMPVTVPIKDIDTETQEEVIKGYKKIFIEKNYWFALSQTKGYYGAKKQADNSLKDAHPDWDVYTALKNLKIKKIPYETVNGNAQGYASREGIAINVLAVNPVKTIIHEMAHILLGHLDKSVFSFDLADRGVQEAEAEMTAYLVIASLGLEGLEYSRNYIQDWLACSGATFKDSNANKVITAADKILKAGEIITKGTKAA